MDQDKETGVRSQTLASAFRSVQATSPKAELDLKDPVSLDGGEVSRSQEISRLSVALAQCQVLTTGFSKWQFCNPRCLSLFPRGFLITDSGGPCGRSAWELLLIHGNELKDQQLSDHNPSRPFTQELPFQAPLSFSFPCRFAFLAPPTQTKSVAEDEASEGPLGLRGGGFYETCSGPALTQEEICPQVCQRCIRLVWKREGEKGKGEIPLEIVEAPKLPKAQLPRVPVSLLCLGAQLKSPSVSWFSSGNVMRDLAQNHLGLPLSGSYKRGNTGTSLVVQGLSICSQCTGHGLHPWFRRIPCATRQLSPQATTTEPSGLGPVLRNERSLCLLQLEKAHMKQQRLLWSK